MKLLKRHCERSEAIQPKRHWRGMIFSPQTRLCWIATSLALLAMTNGEQV